MIKAVLLAAGESKRMGRNKLLLKIKGKRVIDIIIDIMKEVVDDIIVVLGHNPQLLIQHLKERRLRWIINECYKKGMATSFQKGLKETLNSDAVFLLLGDQPIIPQEFLLNMIEAWQDGKGKIVSPVYKGKKGHPILFDNQIFPEILAIKNYETIRDIIHRHNSDLYLLDAEEWSVMDMDNSEDFEKIKRTLK